MLITALQLLDYFGTAVFAISGALVAGRQRMDLMGFLVLATVTGIGGGTLRDLLLDRPVFWLEHTEYLLITVVMAVLTFILMTQKHFKHPSRWLSWADAIGLSAFCVIGAQTALLMGASNSIAVVMAMMTAAFGGLIRDVLAGEPPMLLHREIYASAAFSGAVVYVLVAKYLDLPVLAMIAAFLVTLIVRGLGIVFHWHLPAVRR